ncbi:MAG: hypothetical protein K6C68_14115 [Ruminococcus sp.]|nr:hypothetical protein [Ruminococcus sp.]
MKDNKTLFSKLKKHLSDNIVAAFGDGYIPDSSTASYNSTSSQEPDFTSPEEKQIIAGWDFPFEQLPHWENLYRIAYSFNRAVENAESDTLCLLYAIAEPRMCFYAGFFAVLRCKEHPQLQALGSTAIQADRQPIFSSDGRYIFIRMHRGVFVYDVSGRRYTLFVPETFGYHYNIEAITELSASRFELLEEKTNKTCVLDIDSISWTEQEGTEIDTEFLG